MFDGGLFIPFFFSIKHLQDKNGQICYLSVIDLDMYAYDELTKGDPVSASATP